MADRDSRRVNRDHRAEGRRSWRRYARDLFAGMLGGLPFGRRENTRVDHPYAPGSDPRRQNRRFDSPR